MHNVLVVLDSKQDVERRDRQWPSRETMNKRPYEEGWKKRKRRKFHVPRSCPLVGYFKEKTCKSPSFSWDDSSDNFSHNNLRVLSKNKCRYWYQGADGSVTSHANSDFTSLDQNLNIRGGALFFGVLLPPVPTKLRYPDRERGRRRKKQINNK